MIKSRSAKKAEAAGLTEGSRVQWNSLGREAFDVNPTIRGTLKNLSRSTSGCGYVLWDGRSSADEIDLGFLEAAR